MEEGTAERYGRSQSVFEKLSAPTGVRIRKRKGREAILFFVKDVKILESNEFWTVLNETHDDFERMVARV